MWASDVDSTTGDLYDTSDLQTWLADIERQEAEEARAAAKQASRAKLERKKQRAEARERALAGDFGGFADVAFVSTDEDSDESSSTQTRASPSSRSSRSLRSPRSPRSPRSQSLLRIVQSGGSPPGNDGATQGHAASRPGIVGRSMSARNSKLKVKAGAAKRSNSDKTRNLAVRVAFQENNESGRSGSNEAATTSVKKSATPSQKAFQRALKVARHSFRLAQTTKKLRDRHDSLRGIGVLTSTTYLYTVRGTPVQRVGVVLESSA